MRELVAQTDTRGMWWFGLMKRLTHEKDDANRSEWKEALGKSRYGWKAAVTNWLIGSSFHFEDPIQRETNFPLYKCEWEMIVNE